MKLVNQCCFDGFAPKRIKRFSDDDYFDDNTWSTLNNIAPALNETFIYCKLFGETRNCSDLFVPRKSERGLCYTFNSLNPHDMFTDE